MTNSEIVKELNNINSDLKSVEGSFDLLLKIQQSQGPVIQVLTIIKYEKPLIYTILKTRLVNNPGFKMLFDVSVEYEVAKKSLGLK
jgi:hypothetical protein